MPFLTQGKTNWKFIGIVAVLALIVGGGIFWFMKKQTTPITHLSQAESPGDKRYCMQELDCTLVYLGPDTCPSCAPDEYQCVSTEYYNKVLWPEWEKTHKGIVCEGCPMITEKMQCICKENVCEKMEKNETDDLSFKDLSTEDWQVYKNEEYGFELKHPKNFIIEEVAKEDDYHFIPRIILTDSSFPKQLWEPLPGEMTELEIEEYREKYGIVSSLVINVLTADYEKKENYFGPRAKEIIEELKQKDIPQELIIPTISRLSSYGDVDPLTKEGTWKDGCKVQNILKINDWYLIKGTQCPEGFWQNTSITFLSRGSYIIQIYDRASEYEKLGILDQILSTFRFLE